MKSLAKLVLSLIGIKEEAETHGIQEVFDNMTIIEGEYTEKGRNYVEVEEVARYLEER